MNTGDDNLLKAFFRQPSHLSQHILLLSAPDASTHKWNDTIRAELVAAVLDLDERPGSVCILRRGQQLIPLSGRIRCHPIPGNGAFHQLPDPLDQSGTVLRAGYEIRLRAQPRRIRMRLGQTAGQDDLCFRTTAPQAPQSVPHLPVAGGGHQDQIRILRLLHRLNALLGKHAPQRIGFILVDLAAKAEIISSHAAFLSTFAQMQFFLFVSIILDSRIECKQLDNNRGRCYDKGRQSGTGFAHYNSIWEVFL